MPVASISQIDQLTLRATIAVTASRFVRWGKRRKRYMDEHTEKDWILDTPRVVHPGRPNLLHVEFCSKDVMSLSGFNTVLPEQANHGHRS